MELKQQHKQILNLLAEGKAIKEIATLQGSTPDAVTAKVRRLRRRFACQNTVQLIVKYVKQEAA